MSQQSFAVTERGNIEIDFVEGLEKNQLDHTATVGSSDGVFVIGNRQDIGVMVKFTITKGAQQLIESFELGPKSFLTRRLSVPTSMSPVSVKIEIFVAGLGMAEVAAPDGPPDEYPVIDGLTRQEKTPILLNEEEASLICSETWTIIRSKKFTF